MSDYCTPAEAARLLGIDGNSVRLAIRQGRLPATKVDAHWLILVADLEHYRDTYPPRRGRPPGRPSAPRPRDPAERRTPPPRPRRVDPNAPVLPATRPPDIRERDWTALMRRVRDGATYAEIAAELQVSKQRAQQLVTRAADMVRSPELAGLGGAVRHALVAGGYTTRDAVAQARDDDLLRLKGMNMAKLRAVRRVIPRAD